MAIDPNIALGVRPIEVPNQLAQYGQLQQLMAARDAQQINALKMQEAQAALDERNALRRLNPSAPDYEQQLFKVSPQLGINYRKEAATTAAQDAARKKSEFDLTAARRKFGDDLKRNLSANPSDENVVAWGQDAVLQGIYSEDQVASTVQQLLALPPQQRATMLAQAGASAGELKPSTQTVNRGGATELVQVTPFTGTTRTIGNYADVPLPADVVAQKKDIARAGAPNITNVQEKAEAGEFGKLLVSQFDAISKQASVAAKTLPSIEANLATLNKGLDTGFGTDAKAAGARVLGALGVKDAEKFATDTQTFQANAISAVLQKQLEQKGPQTESDARRIEQIGVELGKTKDANRFILDLAREQLRRDIDQRNFYTDWKKGPGKGSFNGAEDAWFAGEGGKSLFDRPALKKYAISASAASQIPGQRPVAAPAAVAPNIDALLKKYEK